MKKVIFVGAGEYAESVYDSMAKEEYDLMASRLSTPEVPHLWTSNCMYREVMQRECNYPQ